jgi:hypothetical protein
VGVTHPSRAAGVSAPQFRLVELTPAEWKIRAVATDATRKDDRNLLVAWVFRAITAVTRTMLEDVVRTPLLGGGGYVRNVVRL